MDLFEKAKNFTRAREARQNGLYPYFQPISSNRPCTRVMIEGRELIMIGSNNYLGMTHHPRVIEAATSALATYGTGCTGSRFLNGTLDIHQTLERRLASFVGKEAALVCTTGFLSNLSAISSVAGRQDAIYSDRENHASILDGCRLSYATVRKYAHNDPRDLERLLRRNDVLGGKLVVTDGVFSMGGDVVNLPEIVASAREHGARVLVDDAHGIGVLGRCGRGTLEHHEAFDGVDLVMGTFSKSFASIGGFLAGDRSVIDYIQHVARPFIFSASLPPACVMTVMAVLDVLEEEPERVGRLRANVRFVKEGLARIGFNTLQSESAIVPVLIGDQDKTFIFWKKLFQRGVFTNPAVPPAVAPDQSILRTSFMSEHQTSELDQALEAFEEIGKELGVV